MWRASHSKRHAALTCGFVHRLDRLGIIRRLASLKGSSLRRRRLARALFITALVISHSVAAAKDISTKEIELQEKPSYDLMNIKLYLHNKLNDWDQFECANQLGIRESNWRPNAVNMRSGAYGIFQHMSDHAHKWDAYTQIDKHIEYINARYDGSWCLALSKLEREGWH